MIKKIILGLVAGIIVVAGVAAMSAFEAHVINVTAHIENALRVHPKEIHFGTVFPQEYVEAQFTVSLSDSFLTANRADDVEYVINQKPKPKDVNPDPNVWEKPKSCTQELDDVTEARAYCHDNPKDLNCCYLSLCRFLSKMDNDPEDHNDTQVPSYYVQDTSGDFCQTPVPDQAKGYLAKSWNSGVGDLIDTWTVDLKVPPVDGYVGQDWPASCADWVVEQDSQDYGCDLWIEVTGISEMQT